MEKDYFFKKTMVILREGRDMHSYDECRKENAWLVPLGEGRVIVHRKEREFFGCDVMLPKPSLCTYACSN